MATVGSPNPLQTRLFFLVFFQIPPVKTHFTGGICTFTGKKGKTEKRRAAQKARADDTASARAADQQNEAAIFRSRRGNKDIRPNGSFIEKKAKLGKLFVAFRAAMRYLGVKNQHIHRNLVILRAVFEKNEG